MLALGRKAPARLRAKLEPTWIPTVEVGRYRRFRE
jgi:hypothetical protein